MNLSYNDEGEPPLSREDLAQLPINSLRTLASRKSVCTTGKKAQLVDRILAATLSNEDEDEEVAVACSPPSPVHLSTPSRTPSLGEDSNSEKMTTASEEEKDDNERPGVSNLFPQDDEGNAEREEKEEKGEKEEEKVIEKETHSPRSDEQSALQVLADPLSIITPSPSVAPSLSSPRQVTRVSPKKETPSSIDDLRLSLSLLQSRLQVLGAAPGSQELKALCKELGVDERLRLVVSSASKTSKLVAAKPPSAPSLAAKKPPKAQARSPSVAAVVEEKLMPRSPRPAVPGPSMTPVPAPSSASKGKDRGTPGSGDGSSGKSRGRKPVEHISSRLLAHVPLTSATATGPTISDSMKGPPAPATPLSANASTSIAASAGSRTGGINNGSSTKAKHTLRNAVGRSASATRSRPTTVERAAPLPSSSTSATQSTPVAAARSKSVPRQAPSATSASAGTTMEARRALVEASRAQRLAAAEKTTTAATTTSIVTVTQTSGSASAAQRRALVEASRQAREAKAKAAANSSAPPPALASSSGPTRKTAIDRGATVATPSRALHATPSRSNGQSYIKPADPSSKLSSMPLSARKHHRATGAASAGGAADGGTSLMLSAMPPPSALRPKSSFSAPSGTAVTPVRKPSAPTSTSAAAKQTVGVALTPRSGITVTLTPRAAFQAVAAENPFGALL